MKIIKHLFFLLFFNFLCAQELKPETQAFLDKCKKKYNDTIDIKNPRIIFNIGYGDSYFGHDERGEELMEYGLRNMKDLTPEDIRHSSVQNTKNGFFVQAIEKLYKACILDPKNHGYYGWVLLYFFHDYERALDHFNKFDNLTPNFSDIENGDDIHYLKGITQMKLLNYQKAITEFNLCEKITEKRIGKLNYPFELQLYKGRCYEKIHNYKKSLPCFDIANKIATVADNYFYKAMVLKKMNKNSEVLTNLEKAYQLINVGRKNKDNYYEVFDEIYPQDVERELRKIKK